jgi:hypothetical protein
VVVRNFQIEMLNFAAWWRYTKFNLSLFQKWFQILLVVIFQ